MMRFIRGLSGWNIRYGELWMFQWQVNGWLSFGIHLDVKRRTVSDGRFQGRTYGPYLDLHLGVLILSLGWRPYLSGGLLNESGIARGGESVVTDEDMIVERISWSFTRFVEVLLVLILVLGIWRSAEIHKVKSRIDSRSEITCIRSVDPQNLNVLHCRVK